MCHEARQVSATPAIGLPCSASIVADPTTIPAENKITDSSIEHCPSSLAKVKDIVLTTSSVENKLVASVSPVLQGKASGSASPVADLPSGASVAPVPITNPSQIRSIEEKKLSTSDSFAMQGKASCSAFPVVVVPCGASIAVDPTACGRAAGKVLVSNSGAPCVAVSCNNDEAGIAAVRAPHTEHPPLISSVSVNASRSQPVIQAVVPVATAKRSLLMSLNAAREDRPDKRVRILEPVSQSVSGTIRESTAVENPRGLDDCSFFTDDVLCGLIHLFMKILT